VLHPRVQIRWRRLAPTLNNKMESTATNLSALSRLFSSSVYRELAEKGRSPLFARLLSQTDLLPALPAFRTVGAAFDAAFAILRKTGQRDEYVYRAALTHNILLGRHSLNTASMLTEFRVGACKADLVILNGTSTAYEIKSERDSLARLENQLANYSKVFAKTYVVVAEPFVSQVLTCTPPNTGIMALARWNRIKTVREAHEHPENFCTVTIFDSLRLSEVCEVLQNLGVEIPAVPNTKLHAEMRELFRALDPIAVHRQMVEILKRTRTSAPLASLVEQLPHSLRPAALSIRVKRGDQDRLIAALATPIDQALHWS
jgi:hypothetical protein